MLIKNTYTQNQKKAVQDSQTQWEKKAWRNWHSQDILDISNAKEKPVGNPPDELVWMDGIRGGNDCKRQKLLRAKRIETCGESRLSMSFQDIWGICYHFCIIHIFPLFWSSQGNLEKYCSYIMLTLDFFPVLSSEM